jgi:hypothetical protein
MVAAAITLYEVLRERDSNRSFQNDLRGIEAEATHTQTTILVHNPTGIVFAYEFPTIWRDQTLQIPNRLVKHNSILIYICNLSKDTFLKFSDINEGK